MGIIQFIIPILIVLSVVLIKIYQKSKAQNPLDKITSWPYGKTTQLLNPLEKTFYQAMCAHLHPELLVLAKVRIENLVYVPPHARLTERLTAKMTGKYLDFIVCAAADFRPVCAVVFDDAVNDHKRDAEDTMDMKKILDSAGLAFFHYTPQYQYSREDFAPINVLYTSGDF